MLFSLHGWLTGAILQEGSMAIFIEVKSRFVKEEFSINAQQKTESNWQYKKQLE